MPQSERLVDIYYRHAEPAISAAALNEILEGRFGTVRSYPTALAPPSLATTTTHSRNVGVAASVANFPEFTQLTRTESPPLSDNRAWIVPRSVTRTPARSDLALHPKPEILPWVTEWLLAVTVIALLVSRLPPLHGTGRSKRSEVGVPGVIPRTPFDWRGRRAYTVEQVGAIAEILDRYGALTWPNCRSDEDGEDQQRSGSTATALGV